MLTLITGQPGNGKTLHTLSLVEKMRLESNRAVYFHGINELTLPWEPLEDPKAWQNLPDGSIVVIDEAYQWFPVRKQGGVVPDYVDALARHRHRGFDFFLIGQRHLQFDTFLRGLVGRHIEVVRRFGRATATLYQWEKCVDPNSEVNRRDALRTTWAYPQQFFTAYKSAEIHTVQRDFPMRKVALLVGGGVVLLGAIGYVSWHVSHGMGVDEESVAGAAPIGEAGAPAVAAVDPWAYETRRARLAGVPESARLYDQLQEQRSQPSPAGCMMLAIGSAVQCTCTTVQGSKLELPVERCVSMIQRGWFDGTRERVDVKTENISYLNSRDGVSRSGSSSSSAVGTGAASASVEPVTGS